MFVADVIGQVRERLGDEVSKRWSDARLLYVATQGQIYICTVAGVLRRKAVIPMAIGRNEYQLPRDCATLKRVEYNGKYLPLYSRNDTDQNLPLPTELVAIKTNLGMEGIELYPSIPAFSASTLILSGLNTSATFNVVPMYGVVSDADAPYVVDTAFGEVDGLTYDMTTLSPSTKYGDISDGTECSPLTVDYGGSLHGVIVGMAYTSPVSDRYGLSTGTNIPEYTMSGTFGVVTDVAAPDAYITIYYEAVPTTKLAITSAFSIPDMWEDALFRYIVGTALQDDNDAANIQRGEMELGKFNAMVLKARELSSKDFSGGMKDKLRTQFRRI